MIRELSLCDGGVTTVDLRDVDSVDRLGDGCLLHFCNREKPLEANDDYRVIARLWAESITDPRFVGDEVMFHRNDIRVATLGGTTQMDGCGVGELNVVTLSTANGSVTIDAMHGDYEDVLAFLREHGLLLRTEP